MAESTQASRGGEADSQGRGLGIKELVEQFKQRGVELWRDQNGQPYLSYLEKGRLESLPLNGERVRAYLRRVVYRENEKALREDQVRETIELMKSLALDDNTDRILCRRVVAHKGNLFLDLADPERQVIRVGPEGWKLCESEKLDIRFLRGAGMRSLPFPEPGGALVKLAGFLNGGKEAFLRVLCWLASALACRGQFPILMLSGTAGSAKSVTTALLRRVVDPAEPIQRGLPGSSRDLFISAMNSHVLAFNNLERIPGGLGNDLCCLSTGGGFGTRKLHADLEETLIDATRPVILNGIGQLVDSTRQHDLADRIIAVDLPVVPEARRRMEAEIWLDFDRAHPQILGGLLDFLAAGLAGLEEGHRAKSLPRLSDVANFIDAAEARYLAAGPRHLPNGEVWRRHDAIASFKRAQQELAADQLSEHPIVVALVNLNAERPDFEYLGSSSELLTLLAEHRPAGPHAWPNSPQRLGFEIRKLVPALRKLGYRIDPDRRDGTRKNNRQIFISFSPPEEMSDRSDGPNPSIHGVNG